MGAWSIVDSKNIGINEIRVRHFFRKSIKKNNITPKLYYYIQIFINKQQLKKIKWTKVSHVHIFFNENNPNLMCLIPAKNKKNNNNKMYARNKICMSASERFVSITFRVDRPFQEEKIINERVIANYTPEAISFELNMLQK